MHASEAILSGNITEHEKDLLLSNNIFAVAEQQRKDIAWNAALYGSNGHVWIEDRSSFMLNVIIDEGIHKSLRDRYSDETIALHKESIKNNVEIKTWISLITKQFEEKFGSAGVLAGLSKLCTTGTNIEFRDGGDYTAIEKEVAAYDDGVLLKNYYKRLEQGLAGKDRANDYLFNARLVHRVAHCSTQHQIVVVGGSHGKALSQALSLIGYRLKPGGMLLHPESQEIVDAPEGDLEFGIQKKIMASYFAEKEMHRSDDCAAADMEVATAKNDLEAAEKECVPAEKLLAITKQYTVALTKSLAALNRKSGISVWTDCFLATHPINIRAIVEQERKAAAKMAGSASSSSSMPAPVLRARL